MQEVRDNGAAIPEAFLAKHGRYPELLEKLGKHVEVKELEEVGANTISNSLVELTVEGYSGKSIELKVPPRLTVAKLKLKIMKKLGISDEEEIDLYYKDAADSPMPDHLDDDENALSYYCVGNKGVIFVSVLDDFAKEEKAERSAAESSKKGANGGGEEEGVME
eukprot:TRINITY_DN501_c0_g2_i1.p4 TRINITY_DN501_c0_g2~~TRINITY_DN501_c0_g2_i1.p4  ORF type:complete len:164 (-),score=68.29 TRINITY_DN501_c0_g2_i1:101-592(-)